MHIKFLNYYFLGSLLIDEMKLTEGFRFNRDTCQFQGFVDLGEYTSEAQKNEPGDHALVFMFQPFRGKWIQALACFFEQRMCKKQCAD